MASPSTFPLRRSFTVHPRAERRSHSRMQDQGRRAAHIQRTWSHRKLGETRPWDRALRGRRVAATGRPEVRNTHRARDPRPCRVALASERERWRAVARPRERGPAASHPLSCERHQAKLADLIDLEAQLARDRDAPPGALEVRDRALLAATPGEDDGRTPYDAGSSRCGSGSRASSSPGARSPARCPRCGSRWPPRPHARLGGRGGRPPIRRRAPRERLGRAPRARRHPGPAPPDARRRPRVPCRDARRAAPRRLPGGRPRAVRARRRARSRTRAGGGVARALAPAAQPPLALPPRRAVAPPRSHADVRRRVQRRRAPRLLRLVVFSDVAFAWSTTLVDLDAARFHALVTALARPWAWLWRDAVPSLALVEATRSRLEGAYVQHAGGGRAVDPALVGGWWRYLLAAIAYGLLPRALALAVARLRAARLLARLPSTTRRSRVGAKARRAARGDARDRARAGARPHFDRRRRRRRASGGDALRGRCSGETCPRGRTCVRRSHVTCGARSRPCTPPEDATIWARRAGPRRWTRRSRWSWWPSSRRQTGPRCGRPRAARRARPAPAPPRAGGRRRRGPRRAASTTCALARGARAARGSLPRGGAAPGAP